MAGFTRWLQRTLLSWDVLTFLAGLVVAGSIIVTIGPGRNGVHWRVALTCMYVWAQLIVVARMQRRWLQKEVVAVIVVSVVVALMFPLVLVALVTSGSNWDVVGSVFGPMSMKVLDWVISAVRGILSVFLVFLVIGVPELLRRVMPWSSASSLARTLVPAWLATWTVVSLWLSIMLMHFGDNALSRVPVGTVVVAGAGAAILMAPLCQFLARSCWEYGMVSVFSPRRWYAACRAVFGEVFAAVVAKFDENEDDGVTADAKPVEATDPGP